MKLIFTLLLSFQNGAFRTKYTAYFLPTINRKGYNFMNGGRNFFDQPVKKRMII